MKMLQKCKICGRIFETENPKQKICCTLCEEKERRKKVEKAKNKNKKEMVIETMKECQHKDCKYRGQFSGSKYGSCDYMIWEGEPRGCKPSECDKYKPGKKPKVNLIYKKS